jgi:hypothetical protein
MDLIVLNKKYVKIVNKNGNINYRIELLVQCPLCNKIYKKYYHKMDNSTGCADCARIRNSKLRIGIQRNNVGDLNASIYNMYKRSAYKRNLQFEVSKEFLWDLFLKQDRKCSLSGLPLKMATMQIFSKNGNSKFYDRSLITASLDRINSQKGYFEDNVQWVHKIINIMKGNLSDNDFIYFCKNVAKINKDLENTEPILVNGGNYFK